MCIRDFSLDDHYKIIMNSGSRGCQLKYFRENSWFKVNTNGYENQAEYVCSLILKHSNYRDFVSYELCNVNGRPGCCSKNFVSEGEELISFERAYFMYTGKSLTDEVMLRTDVGERIGFVIDFFQSEVGVEIADYLYTVICLDYLTRNCDRHFNNLALLKSRMGYKPAPIFDNGDAFFSSYTKFEPWLSVGECVEKSVAQPFSGSFDLQFANAEHNFRIDYSRLICEIEKMGAGRCKEAALFLLEKNKSIFDMDNSVKRNRV